MWMKMSIERCWNHTDKWQPKYSEKDPYHCYISHHKSHMEWPGIEPGPPLWMDRDSSVGIATRYGLGGPGNESRWGRDFPQPSRHVLGPTQPPVQWVPALSLGVKRPGRGADHPPPSKCRGHERLGLYLYSPSAPQWPVIGRTHLRYDTPATKRLSHAANINLIYI